MELVAFISSPNDAVFHERFDFEIIMYEVQQSGQQCIVSIENSNDSLNTIIELSHFRRNRP